MADGWFGVRCIFRHGDLGAYEERITLWNVPDIDAAIRAAVTEAGAYAEALGEVHFLGLAQAFQMFDAPASGVEVFSLLRDSDMKPDEYLSRVFDSGGERQRI